MASRRGGLRVTASELSVLQEDATRVRNVCILAHVDHGKTTLSDGLVCSNGIISAKLAGKLRYLDSTEDEQKRGITMHSSAISLLYTAQSRQQKPGPLAPNSAVASHTTAPTSSSSPSSSRATNGGVDSSSGPGSDGTAVEGAGATTVAKPESAADGDARDTNSSSSSFLINLIDSPGHIDFSSDVSTATRLCDCALIVVDVLEGVCAQTHAVFRQARAERMRPLLVLNKVDRLASELQLTPLEAWQHLQRLVENVNALTATLAAADELAELDGAPDADAGEDGEDEPSADREAIGECTFSPEKGDVVFCSALDGWGFGLGDFARLWAKRVGCKPKELRRMLWGSFVLNPKTKKVTKWTTSSQSQPMFVTMILDPIWKLYEAAFIDKNETKVGRMATKLGLDVPPRELGSSDPRTVLQAVMKRWLPVAEAVLRMVVEQGPPPSEAQADRVKVLWPQFDGDHDDENQRDKKDAGDDEKGIIQEMDRVHRAVASCDSAASAPVVIFVSKMVPVKRRDITDINGRPWRPALREFEHTEALADGDRGMGRDSEDPDSLAFVAFARVLSGTVTPSTPLLVLGPKYHPLKPGAWRHASPVGGDNDWVSPPSDADTFSAGEPPQGQNPNRYHSLREGHAERAMNAEGGGGGSVALFMMMGASLQPVPSVPAGNILALAGLEGAVNKCATLSDTPACPAMRAVTLQAKAMVRVAVEVLHQQDMDKLELGLSRLYQADPAVEVSVTARGEHVVACLGELHLEQCLKDLRERYAGVELKASQPLVSFRETAVAPGQVVGEDGSIIPPPQLKMAPWADEEGLGLTDFKTGRVRVVTPDRRAAFTLRCLPLPEDVAMLIENHPKEVRLLWEDLVAARLAGNGENGDEASRNNPSSQHASINRTAAFREDLSHALALTLEESVPDGKAAGVAGGGDAGAGWNEGFLSRVLAFGPRNVGANILARCAGGVDVRVMMSKKAKSSSGGEGVEESPALATYAPGKARTVSAEANEGAVRRADVQEATEVLRLVENSVVTGFQLATMAGPLGGEELHGLCFLLERVEVTTDCLSGSGGPSKAGAAPAPTGVSNVVPESSNVGDGPDESPASPPAVAAVNRNTKEVARGDGDEEGSEEEGVRNGVVGVRGTGSAGGESAASSAKGEARVPQHQQQQQRRYGPLSGQVISVVRMGCRASMLCCPVRLVEAFYRCSLQCDQQQLGNMYAVLSKRRGRVVDEDLVEGTQLFLLTALLPVAESFGFANELLKRTSGSGTTPQLAFSHWEVMELDPFWRPQTNEEREDEGEEGHLSVSNIARQYLDRIRRRKGLASNEKIVVAAEKQRTLTRNK